MNIHNIEKKKERVFLSGIVWKATLAAIATAVMCMLALWMTGMIPQRVIAENCRKSAGYFEDEDLFAYVIPGQFNTRQDNYADCILVNIMYHIDQRELVPSLIRAAYYQDELENVNTSFGAAVEEQKEPNREYFRYWHGSMVLLRPLFVLMGIQGARLVLGMLLLALILWITLLVFRRGEKALAGSYILANGILQMWMCAFCLEYITVPLLANVMTLITIYLYDVWGGERRRMDAAVIQLLAVSGVMTCFLDFLTTETLSVTLPLLFLLVFRFRDGRLLELSEEIRLMITGGLAWGFAYAGMFVLKWGLSAMLLGKKAFMEAIAFAGERIAGTVYLGNNSLNSEATEGERLMGAIGYNLGSVFPFRETMHVGTVILCFFGLLFLCFSLIYLFRDKNFSGKMILLCFLMLAVPWLRYGILANHSYLHYFFTYRAQLTGMTAMCYCTWQFGIGRLQWRK